MFLRLIIIGDVLGVSWSTRPSRSGTAETFAAGPQALQMSAQDEEQKRDRFAFAGARNFRCTRRAPIQRYSTFSSRRRDCCLDTDWCGNQVPVLTVLADHREPDRYRTRLVD